MILLFALAPALAAPKPSPLTEEDWATLRKGEVVVRAKTTGEMVMSTGYVLVSVPPDALWPEVLDVKARIPENSTLKAVVEYRRESPTDWYIRSDMSVFGFEVSFHNHYTFFPEDGYASYTLDESQANDLRVCDGWYVVTPMEGPGGSPERSLLVYYSSNQVDVYAPRWVRRWMANDSMENVLEKIRDRAEHKR